MLPGEKAPNIFFENYLDWLERNARTDIQNPWLVMDLDPNAQVDVHDHLGQPVVVITRKTSDEFLKTYIVCPDKIDDLEGALKSLDLHPDHVGFMFAERVPAPFKDDMVQTYMEAQQHTYDFNPKLEGPAFRHLRQNEARAEKNGLHFDTDMQYKNEEISDVVLAWVGRKSFNGNLEKIHRALMVGKKIYDISRNPFGHLYGARDADGKLCAVAATLEMGTYAAVEHIASTRGVERAQEYLETNMWRAFKGKGITLVNRGNMAAQPPSLLHHKEKFARIHPYAWLYAHPGILRKGI